MFPIRLSLVIIAILLGLSFLDQIEGRRRRTSYSKYSETSDEYYPAKYNGDSDYGILQPGYEYRGSYGNKARKSYSGFRKNRKGHRQHGHKMGRTSPRGRVAPTTTSPMSEAYGGSGGFAGGVFESAKKAVTGIFDAIAKPVWSVADSIYHGIFGHKAVPFAGAFDGPNLEDKISETFFPNGLNPLGEESTTETADEDAAATEAAEDDAATSEATEEDAATEATEDDTVTTEAADDEEATTEAAE